MKQKRNDLRRLNLKKSTVTNLTHQELIQIKAGMPTLTVCGGQNGPCDACPSVASCFGSNGPYICN